MKVIEESLDGAKSIEEGESCFIYGERGNMYYGRSQNGKPIVTKQENK